MHVTGADLQDEEHLHAAQGDRAAGMEEGRASTAEAWVRRNCRQVDRLRCGAGGIRSRLSTRRTVEAPIRMPSPGSSPWIR
jgi:hypothetical protein